MATGSPEVANQIPPPRPPAPPVQSACEPHRSWIEQQVAQGRNAMAIYQDLVDEYDFAHRYNSVKRFVGTLRSGPAQLDSFPGFLSGVSAGYAAATCGSMVKYT